MSWEIKSKNNEVKFEVGKVEYNDEWMQERYVTVTIESPAPINFQIGDYLIYRGERFEINYDPGKIKSAPRFEKGDAFRYENVKFNSLADELTRCDFLDVVAGDNQLHFTGLPKFSFYGGVKTLADRIQANLDRAYPGMWRVEVADDFGLRPQHSDDSLELNVSVDTIKVAGALEILVNQFKTYYTIKGRTITIGAAGVPADHLFQWGPGKGLYEIEENAEADQQIVTRLRAYGSTRNIPHRYYNSLTGADGVKLIPDNMAVQYLMLPSFPYTTQDPYIDSKNINALGVREGTKFFDGSDPDLPEIYPSIEGMTAEQLKAAGVPCNAEGALDVLVSAEQMTDNGIGKIEGDAFEGNATTTAEPETFKVTVKDLGFDLEEHFIEGNGEAPMMAFRSGMLGGREFEIVSVREFSEGASGHGEVGNLPPIHYELELKRIYDEDIKLWFPYRDYNAKKDDKFVLLNIRMPEVYIKAASQKLKDKADEWLAKNDYSRSIYAPKIDEIFMARQHDAAMASGGIIKSLHDTLCAGMQLLFEDEDLGIDAAIFIDRLTIIEGEGPIPTYEVVLKEEKTVGRLDKMQNQIDSLAAGQGQGSGGYNASQIRALIDAYGGTKFLSKIKDDRSTGKIAADKGFEAGQFAEGISGARIDGRGNSEVESIKVRSFAQFAELIVNRQTTIEGDVLYSEGDKIEEVVDNGDGTYTLRLHPEWEGYTTAQIENNVCRGIYNDITSRLPAGAGQTTLHNATYYTSWFRVLTVNAAANTVDVVMYPDAEVPAGRNFPPCAMMSFARWGNSGSADDERYAQRQSVFVISSTDGRIMKLTNVTKPIIDVGNVASVMGRLPEPVCDAAGLPPGSEGMYGMHGIFQTLTQVDHMGRPKPTLVFYGPWDPDAFFLAGDTFDEMTGGYTQHIAEYYGCQWLCNVTGTHNPPSWNTTDWTFYLGDPAFRVYFTGGPAAVNPRSFSFTLKVNAEKYNQDLTGSILPQDVVWSRYTEDRDGNERVASDTIWATKRGGAGLSMELTEQDLDSDIGGVPKVCVFTATVTLRDGTQKTATLSI